MIIVELIIDISNEFMIVKLALRLLTQFISCLAENKVCVSILRFLRLKKIDH